MFKRNIWLLQAMLAVAMAFVACHSSDKDYRRKNQWWEYGGMPDQSKYVETQELTLDNIHNLSVEWAYELTDNASYQFNPIVVDSIMYVLAHNNSLVALHVDTGRELWIHGNLNGITRRGLNYWESADGKDKRLLFTIRNTLQAIDATTGKSILDFGDKGIVSLNIGLGIDTTKVGRTQPSTPGRIYKNLILLGSSPGEGLFSTPGHLRAFNVVTGKLAWTFHTIPQPGEKGYDSWPKGAYQYAGGVNVWGEITVDEKRGIAYFPLGAPTYDYYGADRPGNNLYGNSLLALDAETGAYRWHFQTVHHDIWDYDLAAAPQLIQVKHEGKTIDAVAQASKQGFLFVFDRVTGKPLWPIEERSVPASKVPGEKAAPTQPFPTVVPPFNRQYVDENAISDILLSKSEYDSVLLRVAAAANGFYTPLELDRETISSPGAVGGASFGNTASNPEKGIVYVMSQDFASFYKLQKAIPHIPRQANPAAAQQDATLKQGLSVYNLYCKSCHAAGGSGQIGPALVQIGKKMSFQKFKGLVETGQGQMPAFQHLDENAVKTMYAYLNTLEQAGATAKTVENAPSKNPLLVAENAAFDQHPGREFVNRNRSVYYPSHITDTPINRYVTGYGLELPHVLTPPWSYIVAYDLNKGSILWKTPLGTDPNAARKGFKNTGVPNGAQRKGMLVTSSGILFATANDGFIYAYNSADGKEIWKHELPLTSEALPSFYSRNGKDYIVVNATTTQPLSYKSSQNTTKPKTTKGAYIVFSLKKS
ncbi:PQQ-binding-like beta-propeller repeat protein [Sphingobacterium sp. Mn56C]|uniref:outer membrane protein assembly factor BamB family protein n=1 Tax=Sphingobacterium sp. Mn56C TaxID=3395261 RepID=UPI003BC6A35C